MSQIIDPIPNNDKNILLCCYVNATSQIQVARITNIPNWYFERVVFPGQRLVFESVINAILEIHTGMMASAILSDRIPCERLAMNNDINIEKEATTLDNINQPLTENTNIYQASNNKIKNKDQQTLKSNYNNLNRDSKSINNISDLKNIPSLC